MVHRRHGHRGRPLPADHDRRGIGQQQPPVLRGPGRSAATELSAPIKPIVEDDDAEYAPIGNAGSLLLVRSDRGRAHPQGHRASTSATRRRRRGRRWCPSSKEAIEAVAFIGGRIVIAVSRGRAEPPGHVRRRRRARKARCHCPRPVRSRGSAGREDSPDDLLRVQSPLYPTDRVRLRPASAPEHAVRGAEAADRHEPVRDDAPSSQRRKTARACRSSLPRAKDLPLDGSNPTMLYGYGGFSVTDAPTYHADVPAGSSSAASG